MRCTATLQTNKKLLTHSKLTSKLDNQGKPFTGDCYNWSDLTDD